MHVEAFHAREETRRDVNMSSEDKSCLQTREIHRYFDGLVALEGVSLKLKDGQVKGIIGPNGAGKTTLFNIITGFDRPTKGHVFCFGHDITGWSPHQIVSSIGIARTFQITRLFGNLTVLENVMVGRHTRSKATVLPSIMKLSSVLREERNIKSRALELLDFVGLIDQKDAVALNLPYGKQRLLEIARALACEPRILLLDEPAAGLNETETDELAVLIDELRDAGLTILLIEHQMHLVMNICDEIHVLNFGRTVAEGTPSEVQKEPHVIEAYLGREK